MQRDIYPHFIGTSSNQSPSRDLTPLSSRLNWQPLELSYRNGYEPSERIYQIGCEVQ